MGPRADRAFTNACVMASSAILTAAVRLTFPAHMTPPQT